MSKGQFRENIADVTAASTPVAAVETPLRLQHAFIASAQEQGETGAVIAPPNQTPSLGEAFSTIDVEYNRRLAMAKLIRENAVNMGLRGGSKAGLIETGNSAPFNKLKEQQQQAEKARQSEAQWMILLGQLQDDIAELDKAIDDSLNGLKAIYGDDVIGGLADVFLSPEEREGLETEEEVMQALIDKYLNEDGRLKPEYADLDPKVLELLQLWRNRQIAQAIEQKYGADSSPESVEALKEVTSQLNEHQNIQLTRIDNESAREAAADENQSNAMDSFKGGFSLE